MSKQALGYDTFFEFLLGKVPEFRSIYKEHVDYFGELLPHVLMGDFTRFLLDAYRKSVSGLADEEKWHEIVDRSLTLLEEAISSSDNELQSLVAYSFLENLLPRADADVQHFQNLKLRLGPHLQRELQLLELGG